MGSEIIRPHPLRIRQWEACKSRILAKMQTLAEFNAKTVQEMIPDIRIIKENQLWQHGGYESFKHFCEKAIGVTKQHIYKLLKDDEATCKVLEINTGESSDLTFGGQTVTPQLPAETSEEKPLNQAPKPAPKGRKPKPEPEPIEATFTEPITPAPIPAMVTESESIEHARERLTAAIEHVGGGTVCPHCGGAI